MTTPVRSRASRRTAVVALALAAAVALSGCTSWFRPPVTESTSAPTMEDVSADLAPYYHQVLVWKSCGTGMQCTTAKAPLDWSDPARDSISLALVRQVATGSTRLGSLLVNPGGPGGSGYEFIRDSVDYATSEDLQASYDIVGFDPRGVNRSTPVKCYDDPATLDSYIYDIPKGERGTDEWISEAEDASRQFGKDCLKYSGDLLGFVDTVSAARDLDLLRAALGDTALNFLGYSYGTLLGATYADLYPQKTGRLVLDGALDPTSTNFDVSLTQAKGFESALRAFLAECPSLGDCPLPADVDTAMTTVRSLLDRLDASPLRNEDGRELGANTMFTAIIYPLYNRESWSVLLDLFSTVQKGDPSFAFQLADAYFERDPDGTYANNSTEAFTAINCLDYTTDDTVSVMRDEAAKLDAEAPVFGHLMAWGGTGCADWPFAATGKSGPIAAEGSSDILVVGTTNDPATPYVWAQALASQLQNGHLLTYKGEGHTAYNHSNACVNDTVDGFLIRGEVPDTDPMC